MEEDRPKAEARGDKRYGCDRKRNPMGGWRRKGVSQRIWVPAHAALSSADHDNLTVAVCFSTRDSRLRVT